MLSRRNIRIKVMQMLYAMSRDKNLKVGEALRRYRQLVDKSFELYVFNLLAFVRIAQYARQDAVKKTAKLLPTEEDKQFTAKLGDNDLIRSVVLNRDFVESVRQFQLEDKIDEDNIRLIYTEFAKSDEYREYVLNNDSTYEDHQKILLALFKHCINDELFNEIVEDNYANWTDDKSLIVGAMKKTIKALPAAPDFLEDYRPSDETAVDFGEVLFRKVVESDDELLAMIEPTLKNWDADRVAVLDMILLKMALAELMNFPTIPTKVTLNEFVEISKLYSTEKSKDFINGILDRLMKKLIKDGKIQKEGRGLIE